MIPLELEYLGQDDEGIHQWRAVTSATVYGTFLVEGDMIPARSSIEAIVHQVAS